jgi:putative tryptophan/tyrosine transport system substrate-binding protein
MRRTDREGGALVSGIRRRDFVILLGGGAVTARAQQRMPVVGLLHYGSPNTFAHIAEAVRRGLKEAGYVDGQDVAIEYRWAHGHYERLPALAADLAVHRVAVIIAGGTVAAQAAKEATTTIPIVFTSGADPVRSSLVASLSRPGANLTGASLIAAEMGAKRLELTRELLPHARGVAMVVNPNYPGADSEMAEVEAAGRIVGLRTEKLTAGSEDEIDAAFASLAQRRADAVMVGADGFLITRCNQIVALASRYRIPGIYPFVDFPEAGGLMSYGASLSDAYRQAGVYTGRILKGAKPAELPVQQPTRFDLFINLKTARALGLTVPPMLIARAEQVIE